MFVRTQRLTLRPGWPEDANALAQAIGHESVVRNLAMPPWPYPLEAAETFLAGFGNPVEPKFLVFEHRSGAVRLIGGMAVGTWKDEPNELGYWLTPDAWGHGFATEAGRAVLRAARGRSPHHRRPFHRQSRLGPGAAQAGFPPDRPTRHHVFARPRLRCGERALRNRPLGGRLRRRRCG